MHIKIDYSQKLPAHHCASCTHVVFPEHETCPDCGANRPADGWLSIQDAVDSWLGRVVGGRYVIVRKLGSGAMGTVYRAQSLGIARQFAIKIINFRDGASGLDPQQVRVRLAREVEAIGRLRNPHVVPFYELIELYDTFVGIVMDHVEGETLDELVLTKGPLPPRRALKILRQVANGVHEAHESGMIHRDLKPDNIMIEVLPAGDDFAHILDFGIVRMDDGVSMTKGFLGTPLFASPEQSLGGTLDRRSDIYSLGAVLFFMLTSHPPFSSQNVYEILQAHVRRPPPTIAEILGRPVAPELEELVASMLAKSPERRPQTLAETIAGVDHMLRYASLDDDSEPDSVEFIISGRTNPGHSFRRDTPRPGTSLDEDSGSIFESSERDRTGPKAAIFRRNVSTAVRAIAKEKERVETLEFDRVYQGDTGSRTLGIPLSGEVVRAASGRNGSIIVHDTSGLSFTRDGQLNKLPAVENVSAVGISQLSILAGSSDGHVYDLSESQVSLFQDVRRAPISALAMANDDAVWFAGSESGRLYRCSPESGRKMWLRVGDGPPIASVSIDLNGRTFAVGRRHGEVEVAYVANPREPFSRFSVSGEIRSITCSDDGRLVAVLTDDNTVSVHLVDGSGHVVHRIRDERHELLTIAFAADELVGYFALDRKLYARHLDRAQSERTPKQE